MIIHTIDIRNYTTSHLRCLDNGLFHQKSLPFLSIVQALEGSYCIGIDSPKQQLNTGAYGAFIAPADKMQYITHYVDPTTEVMRAQWIFLDVIINGLYRLDDVYDFPVLLPAHYNLKVCELISEIENNNNLCDNLSDTYKLIKILLTIASTKEKIDPQINGLRQFINQNYDKKLTPKQLAHSFNISVSTLFRIFNKHFGITPANYINSVRLSHAAMLLETNDDTIGDIGTTVGIDDPFYFSKLFKEKYGISPMGYRKQVQKHH